MQYRLLARADALVENKRPATIASVTVKPM
jgi:hypothetical protein